MRVKGSFSSTDLERSGPFAIIGLSSIRVIFPVVEAAPATFSALTVYCKKFYLKFRSMFISSGGTIAKKNIRQHVEEFLQFQIGRGQ